MEHLFKSIMLFIGLMVFCTIAYLLWTHVDSIDYKQSPYRVTLQRSFLMPKKNKEAQCYGVGIIDSTKTVVYFPISINQYSTYVPGDKVIIELSKAQIENGYDVQEAHQGVYVIYFAFLIIGLALFGYCLYEAIWHFHHYWIILRPKHKKQMHL